MASITHEVTVKLYSKYFSYCKVDESDSSTYIRKINRNIFRGSLQSISFSNVKGKHQP